MTVLTCAADVAAARVALRELVIAGEGKTRRTVAAFGDLSGSREELMDLGRFLVRLDVSLLLVTGPSAAVHAGAVLEGSWGEESRHEPDEAALLATLRTLLRPSDVLLVSGLPTVVPALGGAA